jgi:murein DD-endopeptidase MepM/ murein hydrolase activator NlpD
MRRLPLSIGLARRAATLALLLCSIHPELAAAAESALVANFRRQIQQRLDQAHWSAESVDLPGLLRELEQRAAAGESAASLSNWLDKEVPWRWCSFAPVAPRLKPNPQFELPFDRWVNWIVGQGVSGDYSHTGRQQFSLDFLMPEGTPILAAEAGTVARVVDGFTRCCLPLDRAYETNQVIVLHEGGSFSNYAHLRKGIPVKEGQEVAAGDLLGYSGSTGYATMPHLHFSVSILDASKQPRTIPFLFRNETPGGYLPKPWRLYQNRPAPTYALSVSLGDRELISGQPFDLEGRVPVQLRVALVGKEPTDVTRDPKTSYVALTPWSLRVAEGRVTFGFQSSQWDPLSEAIKHGIAILTILYQDEKGRRGAFDAWFRFPDAARYLSKPPPEKPSKAP